MESSAGNRAALRLAAVALAVALTLAAEALSGAVASAGAKLAFRPCQSSNQFACGHLVVPLDPSGQTPGKIKLALRRHRAPVGASKSAVIALAGGPGQAAIPFTEAFRELLGPVLATRDLIVFDQRGTGVSHPLRCRALARYSGGPVSPAVKRCAKQLGPSRRFYTTADSVADIEAIRIAGGYEKLVLYGTSYGTKVALQYAQQHPTHVEALVLDSVVAPNGPEPLDLPTFAAIPRVLRDLCGFRLCRHITHDPVRDLRRLVAHIGGGVLHARAIGPRGRARHVRIESEDLLEILLAGDLDPILRAEFPAAVRSALDGDRAALARLIARAEAAEGGGPDGIDVPLYYATTCEEQLFPWSRAASPGKRLAQAKSKIAALSPRRIAPFARRNVLDTSDLRECASWPFSAPAPALSDNPLPAVPTLILSGEDDLRTPTVGARRIAAKIPHSHVLVVPNTGHSVLTTELGGCALKALRALFAKTPIRQCRHAPPPAFLKPTPIAPRRLGAVRSLHGYEGRSGRTLGAIALTLGDVGRQFALDILEGRGAKNALRGFSLQTGGLRSGWARLTDQRLVLHDYSYVPGVTLSGRIGQESAALSIGGATAAHGKLHLGRHRSLVGELGSIRVQLPAHDQAAQLAGDTRIDVATRRILTAAAALGGRRASRALAELGSTLADLSAPAGEQALAAIAYALGQTRAPGA